MFIVLPLLLLSWVFHNTPLPPRGLSTLYSRGRWRPLLIGFIWHCHLGRTWRFLLYTVCQRSGVVGSIRCWRSDDRGSCWWGRSDSLRPWPVVWLWWISPLWRSYSNVVLGTSSRRLSWNLLCQSRRYSDQTVVGTRYQCPAFGGRQRAVTISGVACVDCHFWRWLWPISRFLRVCFKINECWY